MSSGRWQRLDETFAEALQLAPAAREQFVARACGDDAALRAETLSLLAAAAQSGEFMASSALERMARSVAEGGWRLREGTRVGAYTVLRLLGAGGGGEVWRARDDRLGRDVAIKVLLPLPDDDDEGFERFAGEARMAGALNHPNVLTVYDVGEHRGMPFLVTECLEGQSLRQQLTGEPLELDEALSIGLGVSQGLAAAHARGIVHRDLKPENVFIGPDGTVKILDFGLATLRPAAPPLSAPSESASGALVGTAGYLAPELLKGEAADARADLFAVGAILYEMLAGRRPFTGASTFEILHATISADAPDLPTLNPRVPGYVAQIVRRLLRKEPHLRFQSAVDLAWALEQASRRSTESPQDEVKSAGRAGTWRSRWLSWIAAPVAATGLLALGVWLRADVPPPPNVPALVQFTWTLPAGMSLDSYPAVSPDASRVAFVGRDGAGSRLLVRELASAVPVALPGTNDAKQPFWSPDGRSLGFFARGKLLTVSIASGAPVVLADAIDPRGGAWSASGTIIFSPDLNYSRLMKVSAAGGPVEPATVLDRAKGENSHRWPAFLPDGVRFLYFVRSTSDDRRGIYVGRLDQPAALPGSPVLLTESAAQYVAPSPAEPAALVLTGSDGLEVREFDTARAALVGDARTLDVEAATQTPYNAPMVGSSPAVMAFSTSQVPFGMRLGAVDRDGAHLQLRDGEAQNWLRLSPDGTRLARQRIDGLRGNPDIWVDDLARGTRIRVTTTDETDIFPVWSPDGSKLAYVVGRSPGRPGSRRLSIAEADGTRALRSFPCPGGSNAYCEPTDWSPDGKRLLVTVLAAGAPDVWIVATDGTTAEPFLAGPYAERDARWSPDGRWVVYVSDETGRNEVSVRNTVGPPNRFVLSGDGGEQPVWRRDGAEVLFVDPSGHLRATPVVRKSDGGVGFGEPSALTVPPIGSGHWGTQYDVTPDGRRVHFMRRNDTGAPNEIHVIVGWRALLR